MTQPSTTSTHVRLEEFIEKPQYGLTASAVANPVGPKFLRITDIQDGAVNWNTVPFCGVEVRDLRSELFLKPDDIVVARIGATTGKAFLIETCPKAVFASYLMRIRTKNGLLPKFLYYFFQGQSYWRQIEQNKGGKLKGGINIPILKNLHVYHPPQEQQAATVTVLDALQTACNLRKKELELERERKAALMEHLFTRGTHGEPLKETEIGSIPASWDFVNLSDVCSFTTGKLNAEKAVENGAYPFFTCSQQTYRIDTYSFDQEAILLAGNNAKGIYSVKHYKGKFDAYQRTYIISIRDAKRLDYDFLLYDLTLKLGLMQSQSLGALTRFLTAGIINNLKVCLPSLEEQIKIGSLLKACDSKIEALEKESELLNELFQAMLEELMTGRLSVENLVEEVTA